MTAPQQSTEEHDGLDPIKVTILRHLWEAAQEAGDAPWSLAKLSKRTCIPMTTLLRVLNEFDNAGIVDMRAHDDGRRFAALNATGLEIFSTLFGVQQGNHPS
ncbi:ArsR family transcriptional regulator [uncultured Oxalicibacterium sp.]|uniref:ArsR family transcriptional regulator n=1 Tax=uncultured Oxalicibacterium sp. TaxID=1168540 RepID=UPI0025FC83A7|nr:ArsR family transcriptional regulator [uncultured Oxalicibacterium sp.]